jgi:CRISPR/Cas system CMR-associated protein Cmr3 (group 5 of RAMP superfamily)
MRAQGTPDRNHVRSILPQTSHFRPDVTNSYRKYVKKVTTDLAPSQLCKKSHTMLGIFLYRKTFV